MNKELSDFAARLLPLLRDTARQARDNEFNQLALELFALQFKYNPAYRKICEARCLTPEVVEHWAQIPAVPTSAFKELELTCLVPGERTAVFHSSGTTEQNPSRHFHCVESLAVYEASLWPWFARNVVPDLGPRVSGLGLCVLTPLPEQTPHSSLIHMFDVVRQKLGGVSVLASRSEFLGRIAADGSWTLDFDALLAALSPKCQPASPKREREDGTPAPKPQLLLGTAFSFVHLLDFLEAKNLRFDLPAGSRVMETGGYKNRSRSMPKADLHALITKRLGIPPENIVCEYGMSELSSQAYDRTVQSDDLNLPHPPPSAVLLRRTGGPLPEGEGQGEGKRAVKPRCFRFPPWARVQIVSPETRREVAEGETGLIRVFDLANVFSVAAVQTEDLAIRRNDGFELVGRAQFAEPRGCSLMSHSAIRIPHSALK